LGDFERLTQVFVNILDNAAKHSPKNTVISVRMFKTRRKISIQIEDRGKEVDKKDLKRVFEAFYKVNTTTAGMGLGLYLSKQIIDNHKGRIQISSKKGQGVIVTVTLPKLKYD
jgi:two-component system sensor histidine kinase VicK